MQKIKEKFKEHWIIYTILLSPIIGVVVYIVYLTIVFGVINYIDRHQFDSSNQNLPELLSTRSLPPPATDVPVVLPPDPGEAGKKTLEGIDSNNDGVRDDLEREIVYMYPQNEEVRRVLRAMVKKGQDVIITEGDHEYFKTLMISYFSFSSCHDILIFGPRLNGFNSLDTDKLWNLLKNTPQRAKKLYENSAKATPYSTAVGSVGACENIKGQY